MILQSTETPTMQIVRAGVLRAAEELAGSGVELVLRDFQGLDTELMLEYMKSWSRQACRVSRFPRIPRRRCGSALMNCTHRAFRSLP
ncbi:MAG: hypothetical protein ACLR4Z_08865 [Butyricicoccaceae bacterium]